MRILSSLIGAVLAAGVLSACSPPAEPAAEAPTPPAPPEAPAVPTPGPGEGPINIQAMQFDEFSTVIEPGLGCHFEGGDAILLVATAPDDRNARAQGAIKVDGQFVRLTRTEDGGYIGMYEGDSTFTGGGYEVRIDRADGDGQREGIESTMWAATLRVGHSGQSRTLPGSWSCGA